MSPRKKSSTNYQNEQELLQCPVSYTLHLIGGRWKTTILWQLTKGPKRFSELKRAIDGISERMLAKQLKELEEDGLLNKKLFADVPPRSEYSLTPLGHSLTPVLEGILQWGLAHSPYFKQQAGSKQSAESLLYLF